MIYKIITNSLYSYKTNAIYAKAYKVLIMTDETKSTEKIVIPTNKVHKIIKSYGIGRCSKDSADVFANYLNAELEILANAAMKLAQHAGRKTIAPQDARLAIEENIGKKVEFGTLIE